MDIEIVVECTRGFPCFEDSNCLGMAIQSTLRAQLASAHGYSFQIEIQADTSMNSLLAAQRESFGYMQ